MKYCFIVAIFLICMVITIANAATVKRNFEFDQLLIRNIPRYRRELKTKVHDKDSSEESKESDESNENEKISIESSGVVSFFFFFNNFSYLFILECTKNGTYSRKKNSYRIK